MLTLVLALTLQGEKTPDRFADAPGKPEPTFTVKLTVDGMTCDGCAETVRQDLARLRGVKDVKAALVDREKRIGTADVTIAESAGLSLELLRKSLRGYTLRTARVEIHGAAAFKSDDEGTFTTRGSRQTIPLIRGSSEADAAAFNDLRKAAGKGEKAVALTAELVPHKGLMALKLVASKDD